MKRISGLFVLVILSGMLAGCIETTMLVRVNKDGSGTVEETVKMNKRILEQLEEMKAGFTMGGEEGEMEGSTGEDGVDIDMFTEKEVAEKAERMGKGVRLSSYDEISTATHEGYTAHFAFDDINTLRVNQNPESSVPDMSGGEEKESQEEYMLFAFTPGSPARLVITTPTGKDDETDEEMEEEMDGDENGEGDDSGDGEDSEDAAGAIEMMKAFFRGMHLVVAVEVDGDIEETNASFVEGSRMTLIDFEFDMLLDNVEALKNFEAAEDMSLTEAKDIMKEIPGIKFDVEEKIYVTFD